MNGPTWVCIDEVHTIPSCDLMRAYARQRPPAHVAWDTWFSTPWQQPIMAPTTIIGIDDVRSIACAPAKSEEIYYHLEWDAAPAVRFEPKRVAQPKGARRLFGKRWAT